MAGTVGDDDSMTVAYWQNVCERTNPNALRQEIDRRLQALFATVGSAIGVTQEDARPDHQLEASTTDIGIII